MPATSEKTCGTGATSGSPAWVNPSNITSPDGNDATIAAGAMSPPGTVSAELRATNFDFAAAGVAAVDQIDGIEMRFRRVAAGGDQKDDTIKLFWSGAVQGSDQSLAPEWPNPDGADAYASYGGAADTWGAAPTATDVRSSGFGCVIQVINARAAGSRQVRVDVVRMTVHYTEISTGIGFLAQVIGVLPALVQSLILPFISKKRSVTRSAGSVSHG